MRVKEKVAFALDASPSLDANLKAARLAQLAEAGFPVPAGWVLERHEWTLDDAAVRERIEDLLALGPVIVRMALPGEDTAGGSAAGLGLSVANCTDMQAVLRALNLLADHDRDPWLERYRRLRGLTRGGRLQAIVQHQVPRRWLLVLALFDSSSAYVEVHSRRGDVLSAGVSPDFAGPLEEWPFPGARRRVQALCTKLLQTMSAGEHGLDLEIVVDPEDRPCLVQCRPIVGEFERGWPAFLAEVRDEGKQDAMDGLLILDVEHNPTPISPAHAWLLDWLGQRRRAAGHPRVLAGWLYMATLPRDLETSQPATDPPSARQALGRLYEEILPQARRELDELKTQLGDADAPGVLAALDRALALFLAMVDTYTTVLIPARKRAWSRSGHHMAADMDAPYSLRERSSYLDVLPTTWDVASPTFATTLPANRLPEASNVGEAPTLPADEIGAATLLGEWDDHLFALGLAPLRVVFHRAADLLATTREDVFFLSGDELRACLRGDQAVDAQELARRRRRQARLATLRPPLRIYDGHPLPPPPGDPLHGIPVGETIEGPLAARAGLHELLTETPPADGSVVVLPALTAQTAVALHQLGIRAVCCEHGGLMSHAALMARELGLSALIGCRGCTSLPDGLRVRLDTRMARLIPLEDIPAQGGVAPRPVR